MMSADCGGATLVMILCSKRLSRLASLEPTDVGGCSCEGGGRTR